MCRLHLRSVFDGRIQIPETPQGCSGSRNDSRTLACFIRYPGRLKKRTSPGIVYTQSVYNTLFMQPPATSLKTLPAGLAILLLSILFLPATPGANLFAQETGDLRDDPEAREVFEELDRRRRAVTYESSVLDMTIFDNRGRTRVRNMSSYEYTGDGLSKTLIVFNAPADVRGTGLLTISEGGSESQRLWLPALGRVQLIAGSRKAERFMGSDFTYEDLGDQNPDDFSFTMVSRSSEAVVIEGRRKGDSQYDRIVFHIHPVHFKLLRAEYMNKRNEMVKRLTAEDYLEVEPTIWRAGKMTMEDLKSGRKTELRWSDRTFNEPIPDYYFTERQLTRGVQ
jgi:hypothetical protein